MKRYWYSFLSLLLVALGVGFVVLWEFYLSEKINTKPVAVATTSLDPHATITEEHIMIENRHITSLPPDPISDPSELIGKEIVYGIDQNDVFSLKKIDEQDVEIKGLDRVPIPTNWVEALPGTLRRNDLVKIYLVDKGIQNPLNLNNTTIDIVVEHEDSNSEVASMIFDTYSKKPFLRDIRVYSVKDSSNSEVKLLNSSDKDRQDLTANPYKLELLMSEQDSVKLIEKIEMGYKLLITYGGP